MTTDACFPHLQSMFYPIMNAKLGFWPTLHSWEVVLIRHVLSCTFFYLDQDFWSFLSSASPGRVPSLILHLFFCQMNVEICVFSISKVDRGTLKGNVWNRNKRQRRFILTTLAAPSKGSEYSIVLCLSLFVNWAYYNWLKKIAGMLLWAHSSLKNSFNSNTSFIFSMNGPFKVTSKKLGPDFDWPNLHFAYLLLCFTLVFHTGQLGLDNFPP